MSGPTPQLNRKIVRAGAGAGKTTGLVNQIVDVYRLFISGPEKRPPRVILTTFTRKATQELRERLIKKACELEDPKLLQFVTDPSSLHVSTIHGLLSLFLRQVGHLAELDSGFQVLDERESEQLARQALREVLIDHPEGLTFFSNYGFDRILKMAKLYDSARREHGALRAATLDELRAEVEHRRTYWRKKILELAASIREEVPDKKWLEYANEWESIANDLPPDKWPRKPSKSAKSEVPEDWHARIEDFNKELKKDFDRDYWNESLWSAQVEDWRRFQPLAEQFTEVYGRLKDRQSRLDMSDLELRSLEILRARPELGAVFNANWDYWMIDEYQDTSPLQNTCLTTLIGDRPVYFVGDPQQSIYLFRGADVRVFDEAERAVVASGGEFEKRQTNYRSQPDLLRFINAFMASVSSKDFESMDSEKKEPAPRICTKFLRSDDEASELHAIVARVEELCSQGAKFDDICVLGRTHRDLMDVSTALRAAGYPTHVHAARGFSNRREIVDAQALWRFLLNPHDNYNLLVLLRSPWFLVSDGELEQWMADRPASLWKRLMNKETRPEPIERLKATLALADQHGVTRAFEDALRQAYILDLALVSDPAGRRESNLWKILAKAHALEKEGNRSLLELSQGDLVLDPLAAAEGDATSAQEPNCINCMTIHGSKGLEFEHVIIPRMGDRPQTSHTAVFCSSGGRFSFPVWSEEVGDFMASVLDVNSASEMRERELKEFDRWLYVGVTRAKSTLTLSWSSMDRESWASRSPWFNLEAGVKSGKGFQYEIVTGLVPKQDTRASTNRDVNVRKPWANLAEARAARASVTELIAKAEVKLRPGVDSAWSRWQAKALGQRIHRELEALKYSGGALREGSVEGTHAEAIEWVFELNEPPMRDLVLNGYPEWGFQVAHKHGVLEGQIDLWSETDDRIYIIDYKSGNPSRVEDAFSQLSLYAWALRRFGHKKPIELVAIYPLSRKVERRDFTASIESQWNERLG